MTQETKVGKDLLRVSRHTNSGPTTSQHEHTGTLIQRRETHSGPGDS